MHTKLLAGAAIAAAAAVSAGAVAGYLAWEEPDYAEVVRVRPVTRPVRVPAGICYEPWQGQRAPVNDEVRFEQTVIEGMAGGVVVRRSGNETTGTVVVAAGGHAKKMQDADAFAPATRRCNMPGRFERKVVGYVVHYRWSGRTSKVRMDHDPGARLPVRDGKVVLTKDVAAKPEPGG